jgi:hypothetical protein
VVIQYHKRLWYIAENKRLIRGSIIVLFTYFGVLLEFGTCCHCWNIKSDCPELAGVQISIDYNLLGTFLGSQISTRLVPFDITVVFWFYDANISYLLLAHALNSLQGYRSFHEMTVTDSCGCHKRLVESLFTVQISLQI